MKNKLNKIVLTDTYDIITNREALRRALVECCVPCKFRRKNDDVEVYTDKNTVVFRYVRDGGVRLDHIDVLNYRGESIDKVECTNRKSVCIVDEESVFVKIFVPDGDKDAFGDVTCNTCRLVIPRRTSSSVSMLKY